MPHAAAVAPVVLHDRAQREVALEVDAAAGLDRVTGASHGVGHAAEERSPLIYEKVRRSSRAAAKKPRA